MLFSKLRLQIGGSDFNCSYLGRKNDKNIGLQKNRHFCARKSAKIAQNSNHNIDPWSQTPSRRALPGVGTIRPD
jgi:hypothetical protein